MLWNEFDYHMFGRLVNNGGESQKRQIEFRKKEVVSYESNKILGTFAVADPRCLINQLNNRYEI